MTPCQIGCALLDDMESGFCSPVLFEFPNDECFVTGEKAGDCERMDA